MTPCFWKNSGPSEIRPGRRGDQAVSGRETPPCLPKALGERGALGCKRAPRASMQSQAGIYQQAWSFQAPSQWVPRGGWLTEGCLWKLLLGCAWGCSGNHWQVLGLMWSSVCYQPPGKWPLPLPTLHCASLYVLASQFRIQRRLGVTLNVRHPWLPHSSQPGPSVSLCSCRISVPSRS